MEREFGTIRRKRIPNPHNPFLLSQRMGRAGWAGRTATSRPPASPTEQLKPVASGLQAQQDWLQVWPSQPLCLAWLPHEPMLQWSGRWPSSPSLVGTPGPTSEVLSSLPWGKVPAEASLQVPERLTHCPETGCWRALRCSSRCFYVDTVPVCSSPNHPAHHALQALLPSDSSQHSPAADSVQGLGLDPEAPS